MEIKKFLVFGLVAMVIGVARGDDTADQASATTKKYVTDELSDLQNTIPAQSGARAITYTTTPGTIAPREVKTALGTSTTDTAMPTVGAVNTGLATKQNTISAVDANTVVTYTDTAGMVGQKGIYQDTGTYAEQSESLIDAGTFNAALQNALNMEFVCAGYVDDDPTKPCWLWQIHNESETRSPNLFNKDAPGLYLCWVNYDISYIGKTIGPGGAFCIPDQGIYTSAPIPVQPNVTYTVSNHKSKDKSMDNPSFLFLDENLIIIDGFKNIGRLKVTFTVPDNANIRYVVFPFHPTQLDMAQFEQGSTATPYIPYGNVYIPQNQ